MQAKVLEHQPWAPYFTEPAAHPAVDFSNGLGTVRNDVVYAVIPGYRPLTLDFYAPANATSATPMVMYIHGGGWIFGTNKPADWQSQNRPIIEEALAAGIAVASLDYRLAGEAEFPACVQDAAAAIRWLRNFANQLNLDESRFAVWGESAGGHIAAMVSMNSDDPEITGNAGVPDVSSKVVAGVLWYPVVNFETLAVQKHGAETKPEHYRNNPEAFLLGVNLDSGDPIVAFASPINHINPESAHVLFLHGDSDVVVPAAQSVEMSERMTAQGKANDLVLVPGANHVFGGTPMEPQITRSVAYLKSRFGL